MYNYTVLFDKSHQRLSDTGESYYSDVLFVPPNKAALLSLYNMSVQYYLDKDKNTGQHILADRSCITVHKVLFTDGNEVFKSSGRCDSVVDFKDFINRQIKAQTMRHEPVIQDGCVWKIDPCNNFALLPIPGFYLLELHDANQADVAFICYNLIDAAGSSIIPDVFKLGG